MRLSIYLGEDEIRAVLGRGCRKPEILDCMRFQLKQGALINDLIADRQEVQRSLLDVAKRFSHHTGRVHLILGGDEIITKSFPVPAMTKRQLMNMTVHELKALIPDASDCDYVYTYRLLPEGIIFCAAMKRSIIEDFKELFSSCGLKLTAVGVAAERLNDLADTLSLLQNKTFILAVADGRSLTVSMYLDGSFRHSNRLRLAEERGTPECRKEMEEFILSAVHFYRMQKEKYGFEFVCLCGLNQEEETEIISLMLEKEGLLALVPGEEGLVVNPVGELYFLKEYLYATAGITGGRESINLLASPEGSFGLGFQKLLNKGCFLLLPAAVALAFFLDYGISKIQIRQMKQEIGVIQNTLEAGLEVYEKAKEADYDLKLMKAYQEGSSAAAGKRAGDPGMTGDVYRELQKAAEDLAIIMSMKLENGILRVEGSTADGRELVDYVSRLEEAEVFERIDCSGFSNMNPDTGSRDGGCYFELACTLKEGA